MAAASSSLMSSNPVSDTTAIHQPLIINEQLELVKELLVISGTKSKQVVKVILTTGCIAPNTQKIQWYSPGGASVQLT